MLALRPGAAAAFLLLCGILPAAAQQAPGGPPPTVTTAVVREQDVTPSTEFIGRVQAIQDFAARARVEGNVERVAFKEGQTVKAGDLLYVIEPAPYQAAVDIAQANLAGAEATQREAERAYRRADELRGRGNISQAELDQAQAARESANATVMQMQAQLRQAQLNLGYTHITSPIDGRIGATAVTRGDLVNPSTGVLATVVQLDPIRVVFSVSDRELLAVQRAAPGRTPAQRVGDFVPTLRLADGSTYPQKGQVSFISNQIDPQTGTIPVYADFANPDGLLLPGQFVTVVVRPAESRRETVAPVTAIQRDQQGAYVLALDASNRVQRRPVKTGDDVGSNVVITDGVQEGETVVVDGAQKVRPGMTVQPVPSEQMAEQPQK